MAASRFRPPKLNRKSRKGLQNKPLNTQTSIRKALHVLNSSSPSDAFTISGCYCSYETAIKHARLILNLPAFAPHNEY